MDDTYLRPGTLLHHGEFRIEGVLGVGGFGITYLAVNTVLEKKVAIKEFFPSSFCERDSSTGTITLGTQSNREFIDKLRKKFLKEARYLASLNYPNIIRIFTAFEENGTAYYAMEYIDGMPLSEIVKKNGPLSEHVALKYIREIGEALVYLHKQRINHLDVKPANIMIRWADDTAILIDFGISKQYDQGGHQTSTTPVGVSHGYAPIEQYTSGGVQEFSPQTDVYSLAATLYYLLTGVVPPEAPMLAAAPLEFPPQISSSIRNAISRAMKSGRHDRHRSVAEFLGDLFNPSEKTDNFKQTAPPQPDERTRFAEDKQSGEYKAPSGGTPPPATPPGYKPAYGPMPEIGKKSNSGALIAVCAVVVVIALVITLTIVFMGDNPNEDTYWDDSTVVEEVDEVRIVDTGEAEAAVEAVAEKAVAAEEESVVETQTYYEFNGATGIPRNGYICYFFEGDFSDDDGQSWPVKLALLEKDGRISSAVYRNVQFGGTLRLSVTLTDMGAVMTGRDGSGTFVLNLYDNGHGYSGRANGGDGTTLDVYLEATDTPFSF